MEVQQWSLAAFLPFLGTIELPEVENRTLIGITVAISGNILISLALNLQKLAHKRVRSEGEHLHNGYHHGSEPSLNEQDEDELGDDTDDFPVSPIPRNTSSELQPLLLSTNASSPNYGANSVQDDPTPPANSKQSFISRLLRLPGKGKKHLHLTIPVDVMSEEAALHGLQVNHHKSDAPQYDQAQENEGEYLKSKLWWTGFLMMNVGELGNFISYAFAPASVVAPLGTFALMANCFFAPLLLGEHFRKRDLAGIAIAILGAVTVVLASNASDTRLDPEGLLHAIRQNAFIIYTCVYIVGGIILATLSEGRIGRNWVFVDVGLCALFGGFTVLSTKALSTLITLEWIDLFKQWIVYPLIIVLISTGVGQIRYLNRALMRFDSKVVIPIQFVLFTLSAIIGSAILYGDFQKAQFHEIVTFLYGCAATFAGVFIIAWNPSQSQTNNPPRVIEPDEEEANGEVATSPDSLRLGMGTMGRRRRATLILPSGVPAPKDTPSLGRKRSGVGLMAISPAQHLLLVHTPPREIPTVRDVAREEEEPGSTSNSYIRSRTRSWYDRDDRPPSTIRAGTRTRDDSVAGRIRTSSRVGSLDG